MPEKWTGEIFGNLLIGVSICVAWFAPVFRKRLAARPGETVELAGAVIDGARADEIVAASRENTRAVTEKAAALDRNTEALGRHADALEENSRASQRLADELRWSTLTGQRARPDSPTHS